MIPFKLNGKQIQFPSSWHDLTFAQHIKIMEGSCNTYHKLISLFTGIDEETIRKYDEAGKIAGIDQIITALNFLKTPSKFDTVTTEIGTFKLPINHNKQFNIQFESLAQFEDMRARMLKVPDNDAVELAKAYPSYIAIYLQKIRDGRYVSNKAKEMEAEIWNYPAYQVITLGGFFLIKLLNLLTGIPATSQTTTRNPKKKKPVSRNSKRRLGPSGR